MNISSYANVFFLFFIMLLFAFISPSLFRCSKNRKALLIKKTISFHLLPLVLPVIFLYLLLHSFHIQESPSLREGSVFFYQHFSLLAKWVRRKINEMRYYVDADCNVFEISLRKLVIDNNTNQTNDSITI